MTACCGTVTRVKQPRSLPCKARSFLFSPGSISLLQSKYPVSGLLHPWNPVIVAGQSSSKAKHSFVDVALGKETKAALFVARQSNSVRTTDGRNDDASAPQESGLCKPGREGHMECPCADEGIVLARDRHACGVSLNVFWGWLFFLLTWSPLQAMEKDPGR